MTEASSHAGGNFFKPLLFFAGFYLIYQPNFWTNSYVPMIITLGIAIICVLALSPYEVLLTIDGLKIFEIGVLLSIIYFAFRALLAGNDPRIFQNIAIILNVLALVLWLEVLRKYFRMTTNQVLTWILWMVVIQCFFALIMLVSSGLRAAILARTATSIIDNQFIYGERLYGISSDYTFFTPIYHSIVGLIAIYLGMNVSKKYYWFIPFCVFIIVLNGRTGLVTLVLGFLLMLAKQMITSMKGLLQGIVIIVISIGFVFLGLSFLQSIQPDTYTWIVSGFEDTLALVFEGDKQGNYEQLTGSFLMFPTRAWNWLFGYGVRVYAGNKSNIWFGTSDIGYINDLFMGGLVYMGILYSTIIAQLIACHKKSKNTVRGSLLFLAFLIVLMIANYKGEAARSGMVLTSIVFLSYLFSTEPHSEETTWKSA
ncbi:polysaccharide polymerase [Lactiplantibacillus plantarum]|uniref:polysaccharide polymerase n=1 Tax=Lactiplantibacillus plantarum TaxID=1590 RepID=UPI0021A65F9C|nr:polysaccharide polymerase [Lactiplantibacillus plantarum]MCT3215632.1 polysaccharide polymerase [Lactiplantibacillus plantarum]MCT3271208.1 polysaccharide polymerase [Lactiplantibacillus plantarum]